MHKTCPRQRFTFIVTNKHEAGLQIPWIIEMRNNSNENSRKMQFSWEGHRSFSVKQFGLRDNAWGFSSDKRVLYPSSLFMSVLSHFNQTSVSYSHAFECSVKPRGIVEMELRRRAKEILFLQLHLKRSPKNILLLGNAQKTLQVFRPSAFPTNIASKNLVHRILPNF